VLEAETIGSGATSKTTAFITQAVDTPLADLVSMFGSKRARLVWESGEKAIDAIEQIVKQEKIDCGFSRCPLYIYGDTGSEFKSIEEEYTAAKKLGFSVRLHKTNNLPFKTSGHLEIKRQAKFNAGKYLEGLASSAVKNGANIFEHTKAAKTSGKGPFKIKTLHGTVTAKQVIIATYDPLGNPKETRFKKGMYKSYVFELSIPKNRLPEALYVDAHNPYHYFRVDRGRTSDSLIIGGEDHRAELKINPKKNFQALKNYLDRIFPGLDYTINHQWSGPILEPSDGLPLIGKFQPNQFVAAAFSGNGMTYSTISALMFRKLLLGQRHPWQKLYDPTRIPTIKQLAKKGLDYAGEFFGGAAKNIFK
jgi:glycine/D-amino acid oxidase-like deaminating enzyme